MTELDELKEKIKIHDVTCMGDIWHNEYVDVLFSGIESNKENIGLIELLFFKIKPENHEWIHDSTPKKELKKLNAIMKSKTEQTKLKRINSLIYDLTSNPYMSILNHKRGDMYLKYWNM